MTKQLSLMTDLEIIEMIKYNQSIGKGDAETGREYCVTREKIRDFRRKHNIDQSILKEYNHKKELKFVEKIRELAKLYNKPKDIALECNVSVTTVRKLMDKHNIKLLESIKCAYCNKTFIPSSKGRKNVFCSDSCRYSHKHYNKTSKCKNCGKEFKGSKDYCSVECRKNTNLKCVVCNKEFRGFHLEKFCSDECKQENERIKYKEYISRKIEVECEICGSPMMIKANSKRQRICSLKCKNKYLDFKVNSSLKKLFDTTDEKIIKELVRRKINEKAC